MYTRLCPGVELGEGAGEQLTCQCPQSLSLKSAEALVAAAVSVLIPLLLRCQLPRGSGIKPVGQGQPEETWSRGCHAGV